MKFFENLEYSEFADIDWYDIRWALVLLMIFLALKLKGLLNFQESLDFVDDVEALREADQYSKTQIDWVILSRLTTEKGYNQEIVADIVMFLGSKGFNVTYKSTVTGVGDGATTRFDIYVPRPELTGAKKQIIEKIF